MFRFVCLLAAVAMCNAGIANYNGAAVIAPTYTSEQQNVVRSYGNLQQVSYNSKTIDTPYSSVSKSDVRVSNPGIQVAHVAAAPVAYASPAAYHHAPAYHAQPITYGAYAAPAAHHSYQSAPTYQHSAPVYAHQPALAYAAQPAHQLAYAAPKVVHAAPAVVHSAPLVHSSHAPAAKLLGVAYSPSTSVSHMSYSAPLISYAW